jgi:hypothetical protein
MPSYTTNTQTHLIATPASSTTNQKNTEKSGLGLVAALCGLHQKHILNTGFSFKHNK